MNEEMINAAYDQLLLTLADCETSRVAAIDAQFALDEAIAIARASGEIEGRNAEQRAAAERVMFQDQFAELRQLDAEADHGKFQLELARVQLSRVRALLRLAELKATAAA